MQISLAEKPSSEAWKLGKNGCGIAGERSEDPLGVQFCAVNAPFGAQHVAATDRHSLITVKVAEDKVPVGKNDQHPLLLLLSRDVDALDSRLPVSQQLQRSVDGLLGLAHVLSFHGPV